MDDEMMKKVAEGGDDNLKENTLWSMLHDFYNRKMLASVILTWIYFILIAAVAIYSASRFFKSDEVKDLILNASIFICCMVWLNLIKIWAWQMIHRNNIKREIKRLELRIAELTETVKSK